MPSFLKKYMAKIIWLIVIFALILMFRETIITDDTIKDTFNSYMKELPFAKIIADILGKLMKCPELADDMNGRNFMNNFFRLVIMAIIQAPVVGFLMALLLPMPKYSSSYDMEKYTEKTSYKLKEFAIKLVSAPFLAVIVSKLTAYFMAMITEKTNGIVSVIIAVISILSLSTLSVVTLVILGGVKVIKAVLWRFLITFGMDMVKSFCVDVCCLYIYMAFVSGAGLHIFISIVSLIIVLILLEIAVKCLQQAIVR